MRYRIAAALILLLPSIAVHAWEANVTTVMHHYNYVAVYLSPDPGPLSCGFGQPYLIAVDETAESKERIALVMMAIATGKKIGGYDDGCVTAIWAQSRPVIQRLWINAD